jgi:deoxyribodipyrimidine photo-lyase
VIPKVRLRRANTALEEPRGDYVLYWMIAARRLGSSHALDHALERAHALGKPLLILEPLRCGYPFACDRFHRFVLDGMAGKRGPLAAAGIGYYPYVEPEPGAGRGLLLALSRRACLVVTDDSPAFFLPRMVAAAAQRLPVALHAVDGSGLAPLAATLREFPTAYAFRRFLQKDLPGRFGEAPDPAPLPRVKLPRFGPLPHDVAMRWPPAGDALLEEGLGLAALPIDHAIGPTELQGGEAAAEAAMAQFLASGLPRYDEARNDPDTEGTSGLSPWLHVGHLSTWTILRALAAREGWSPAAVSERANGSSEGWWGMSRAAEAFLDELVTWREVGFVFAHHRPDHDRYEALPDWAIASLESHAGDARPHLYDRAALEEARTRDPLWNAAQRQLVREGRIHPYLRMLWGKKVLEWSASPREALATLFYHNARYALDGRDPNSSSGICWTFGRFDRPWPERPISGVVRSMSSARTAKKVSVVRYVERYGETEALF